MARVPSFKEIKYYDPTSVFRVFSQQNYSIFLDSAQALTGCGRYSFICIEPSIIIQSINGISYLNHNAVVGNPFDLVKQQLAHFHLQTHPNLPPFQTGAAGYFGYDLCQQLESITPPAKDALNFADMFIGIYDVIIAFDNELHRSWIVSSGFPEADEDLRQVKMQQRIEQISAMLTEITNNKLIGEIYCKGHEIQSNFTPESYMSAVEKAKQYILDGDIFEVNLSQRYACQLNSEANGYDLYRKLRAINPAPFAAYLVVDDTVIASASPERFLKLADNHVETRPIKGTIARSSDPRVDQANAQTLLASEKDKAENIMIVDLMRNDLSRVCKPFSVQTPQLCQLESYATVHHLVSVVRGELSSEYDVIDLLKATFPGGSITGAPKIRAMEIIYELEGSKRGPYCGSIGYISFDGNMDSSIVIRTFCIKGQTISFQVGGAIVLDSDPKAEFDETIDKARALQNALTKEYDL